MIVGVPKEIKNHEYRVGLVPASVLELTKKNHRVIVEKSAGLGIGFSDQDYINAGATIAEQAEEVFAQAELIIKVKEPQHQERLLLRKNQILFTYLHLAPDLAQTEDLINSGAVCIAYETVSDKKGGLPLLAPMSEIAGRMSIQAGAQALEKSQGGSGLLLGGVPGVEPAKVVIIGGGTVGRNACQIAIGMGAEVTILDRSIDTLRSLEQQFGSQIKTVYSNSDAINKHVLDADLVIGSVLIPGAAAPKLITKEHISKMKAGSAIVDVAIDQGGCMETSRPTTHQEPTFIIDDVVHYCVANMPGAVAKTSTFALNNMTLPYILKIADLGYQEALWQDEHLLDGLNVIQGNITCKEVAESHNLPYTSPREFISR